MDGGEVTAMEDLPGAEPFETAFIDLYRDHSKELVEMLWVFVGDKGTAEDIVQEAFLSVHRAWPRLDHTRSLPGYLRTTAFNVARSGFRRRLVARRHRPPAAADAASAESGMMLGEDQREVILDRLSSLIAMDRHRERGSCGRRRGPDDPFLVP